MTKTLKGTNGVITADEKKVTISRKTLGGFVSHKLQGDRTIYYKDMSSVEYKRPSMMANGYIQFIPYGTIATDQSLNALGGTKRKAIKDPNAVLLKATRKRFANECDDFYNYVMPQLENYK